MSGDVGWLDETRPPALLRCVYCGAEEAFPHAMSLRFCGLPWHLHRCPRCDSLTYDMAGVANLPRPEIADYYYKLHARYYLEAGYNTDFIVLCALAALGDLPDDALRDRIFFDVGAGIGLGAYFVQETFGADVLAIEPSPSGALGRAIFGIDLRPDYFEDLAPEVMARLKGKPCLVHLNAVVEHLVDPRGTLETLVAALNVETLAIVVPDGGAVDPSMPLLDALGTLSPNEHLHLPTEKGLIAFMRHLGFAHHAITASSGLLICVGARQPVSIPSPRSVALASMLLLERLACHPHRDVASGAAARLLPRAVLRRSQAMLGMLRATLAVNPPALLAALRGDAGFDRIPLHLASTCFWLAVDAVAEGRLADACAHLDVVEAFADRIAEMFPQYSSQPQQYKWEARLYRAQLLLAAGDAEAAAGTARGMVAARTDLRGGPDARQVARAEAMLAG
jgi:hypothetical protein